MRRLAPILIGIVLLALIGWAFPLFHVVPLKETRAGEAKQAFNAEAYATAFWRTKLVPGLGRAVDAKAVLDGLRRDAAGTGKQYGRTLGMSDSVLYLVKGTGTIVAVEEGGIEVSLEGAGGSADLRLKTGLLFSNTVRDASGLLDVSAFADSQDFNAVSAALNHIVETEVVPALKASAQVGKRLSFVAALEVAAGTETDRPLVAIPLEGKAP